MIACVTGGAGFIGSHLAKALASRGDRVVVVDNLLTGSLANLDGQRGLLQFVRLDISRPSRELVELLRGVDCVFHLAALPSVVTSVADPVTSHAHCGTSTLVLLDAMQQAGVQRIVYSSSCAVYGTQPELPWRTIMAPHPASPYAADKLAGEHYLEVFHKLYGMTTIVLRYFNVYGPGQPADSPYAAVIPRFAVAMRANTPPTIFGDGRQTRDFIHVRDVVEANLRAADIATGYHILNVASGRPTSILDVYRLLHATVAHAPEPIFAHARPGDIAHSYGDVAPTEKALCFRPRVRLEEGIAELVG